MPASPEKIVQLRIRGRVQGVGYRAWAQREAIGRGLSGWIRNCRNGDVEAVFAGPATAVSAIVDRCWRGPPLAEVEALDQRSLAPNDQGAGDGIGFTIRPPAE